MSIVQLLGHKNPQNHFQAIEQLSRSQSPYGIELLRVVAQRTKDAKMREACKKAAGDIKRDLSANGKRKKNTDLSAHVEVLMALAMLTMQDLDSIKEAKRAVVRAYGLDMELLSNSDYQDIAQEVFHSNLNDVEEELRHFTRQSVKHHRTLKSGYPFYMYLIDIPVLLILGGAIFGTVNPDFGLRLIRYTSMNSDEINWDMVQIVAFILTLLVVARIFYLLYEQWEKKKLLGWEKEARRMAIDNLESEIAKLSAAR